MPLSGADGKPRGPSFAQGYARNAFARLTSCDGWYTRQLDSSFSLTNTGGAGGTLTFRAAIWR